MSHIFKILQYLSIDVAIGSIGSSVLAVKVLNTKLPFFYWLILPLCVWIIYTTDHLLDAFKIKDKTSGGRHAFHFVHRRIIMIVLFLTGMLTVFLVERHLHKEMVIFGLGICLGILVYLLLNHFANRIFKFFPREFVVAVGYIAGTWGIPLLSKYPVIGRHDGLFLLNHFIIILCIPLLYSVYEFDADLTTGFISFSTTFGTKIAGVLVTILLAVSSGLASLAFILFHNSISIVLLFMTGILFLAFFFRHRLVVGEKYRTVSDSVNILPFLLLIR